MKVIFRKGDPVRVLVQAGGLDKETGERFAGTVEAGAVGEYVGPHPSVNLKGWHFVKCGELLVPLTLGMFEAVEVAR